MNRENLNFQEVVKLDRYLYFLHIFNKKSRKTLVTITLTITVENSRILILINAQYNGIKLTKLNFTLMVCAITEIRMTDELRGTVMSSRIEDHVEASMQSGSKMNTATI
jgi:hypothetical protein